MKFFLLSLLGLMTGCAAQHKAPTVFTPPAVSGVAAPVQRTRVEVCAAVADLDKLAPHVTEAGRSQLVALKESLASAQSASVEAQQGLIIYATQVDAQTRALNAAITDRNKAIDLAEQYHAQAHNNARERDVILIFFAIIASFWIGTMFAGEILRNFPAPWSFVAAGLLYVAVAIGTYALGRFVLHAASRLIP
jgi:hypothetical protein